MTSRRVCTRSLGEPNGGLAGNLFFEKFDQRAGLKFAGAARHGERELYCDGNRPARRVFAVLVPLPVPSEV